MVLMEDGVGCSENFSFLVHTLEGNWLKGNKVGQSYQNDNNEKKWWQDDEKLEMNA